MYLDFDLFAFLCQMMYGILASFFVHYHRHTVVIP